MLTLVYFSNVSGNTHRFLERYLKTMEEEGQETPELFRLEVRGEQPTYDKDYILITPTYGSNPSNHVPPQVKKFLTDEQTRSHCVGVVGTGNINFGPEFAAAADLVAKKLNVPVFSKIDFVGEYEDMELLQKLSQLTREDIQKVIQKRGIAK